MIPTSPYARSSAADCFRQLLSGGGYRVVLSGLGGDELLGGVPTPVPELADLLVGLDVRRFLARSFEWALAKRKPILDALVFGAAAVSTARLPFFARSLPD